MRQMPKSDALETRIRQRAAKLEQFHPNIIGCDVTVDEQRRRHRQGVWFDVRIAVRIPGHDIVVNRDHGEDAHVAVRDAFDAVTRRLEDLARMQHGDVKTHPAATRRTAAWNASRTGPTAASVAPGDEYEDAVPGSLLLEERESPGAEEAAGAVDDWTAIDSERENVLAEPAETGGRTAGER
jgi:ribosome-associated translation inhibitor RaiA